MWSLLSIQEKRKKTGSEFGSFKYWSQRLIFYYSVGGKLNTLALVYLGGFLDQTFYPPDKDDSNYIPRVFA